MLVLVHGSQHRRQRNEKRHECRTHSILIVFAAYSVINNKRNNAVVPEMRIKKNITAMTMKHTGEPALNLGGNTGDHKYRRVFLYSFQANGRIIHRIGHDQIPHSSSIIPAARRNNPRFCPRR